MRGEKVSGIVLRRSNFQEADKLLTVFTREKGKQSVLAKGVRRIKSRRAPHLELFNHVDLLVHHGKAFDTVVEAKVIDDFIRLKLDLKSTGYLFYLAEVLDRILPEHQAHEDVFDLLIETINKLSSKNDQERIVKEFVIKLLWTLGYLPRGEYPKEGATRFVEGVVERQIKSKKFLEEI